MYSRDDLARFIAMCRGAALSHHRMTDGEVDQTIRTLNAWGLLSTSALARLLGVSSYHVEHVVGTSTTRPRGKLNPNHLPWLGYMVSSGKVNPIWLELMLDEGTSLSTISDLTDISESTLHRHRRKR